MDCSVVELAQSLELPAAAITFLVLVWVFLKYQLDMEKLKQQQQ